MAKTVLILGNGFDLAHKLPTSYIDFLNFCYVAKAICGTNIDFATAIKRKTMNEVMREKLINIYNTHYNNYGYKEQNDENEYLEIEKIYQCTNNNIWYNYLCEVCNNDEAVGKNWIDFESEISFIIQSIDKSSINLYDDNFDFLNPNNYENDIFINKIQMFEVTLKHLNYKIVNLIKLRKDLYDDLKNLTKALEIYLYNFVEKIEVNDKINVIEEIKPDYIINFNYTHTYQTIYGGDIELFHVHGEVNKDPNNMVLGIDEYWTAEKRDTHTNFTIFKKFAQRIQKRTGNKHFEIANELAKHNELIGSIHCDNVYIYIFGHSLDVTDRDILKMFLSDDFFNVTIFCKDEETEGEYIANIIKIIGEEQLIKRVNQDSPKFKFEILPKAINEEEVSANYQTQI